jgi:hypothetical protein
MKPEELRADGFERVETHTVGVPYSVWSVDLEVEEDRDLRLIEETILRLIRAGVRDQAQIGELMGLTGDTVLSSALNDLLTKNALTFGEAGASFDINPLGSEMLAKAVSREARSHRDVRVCHDPYLDQLQWFDGDEETWIPASALGQLSLLPGPIAISEASFEARHRELQRLIEAEGLPSDPPLERGQTRPKRDLVRTTAIRQTVWYRRAELEVWRNGTTTEQQLRVIRDGGEQTEVSDAIMDLAAEGQAILPAPGGRSRPASTGYEPA